MARYLRKFYPWYVTRLGEGKVLQDRLQRTQSIAEAREALGIGPARAAGEPAASPAGPGPRTISAAA